MPQNRTTINNAAATSLSETPASINKILNIKYTSAQCEMLLG